MKAIIAWYAAGALAGLGAAGAQPRLVLSNPGNSAAQEQAATLGFVFAPGDIPAGKTVAAKTRAGILVPIQVDAKATHADGSLRHAVLTLRHSLSAQGSEALVLDAAAPAPSVSPVAPSALLATDYDAKATLTLAGATYTASARAALQAAVAAGKPQAWLSGPLVSEWLVNAPFADAAGKPHPHLSARFEIRAYAGMQSVRTGITIENDWAYAPNPTGFTYDVHLASGTADYAQTGLRHAHHARWRKLLWWGVAPALDAALDRDYLLSTGAVPPYDRSVVPKASVLAAMPSGFAPMSPGDLTTYMPETGAHDDIGPLPRFAALYLLSMDARARDNVLANGMAGGSYPIHYRDQAKDAPVSLDDYPYMTLLGNPGDTRNPATGKEEGFPDVTAGLDTLTPDDAHQPSIAYLPYLITGDAFYLDELHFWANWNMVIANPYYRDFGKGLLKWAQVRGQAWSLRTLGHAAYITPDADPFKAYFTEKLRNNLEWYRAFSVGPDASPLGWLGTGNAFAYEPYGIAPWQDDFFTYAVGDVARLGFAEAKAVRDWKAHFVVGRMADTGYCWLHASAYSLQIGPADKSRLYPSFGEIYQANFPSAACAGTAMDGYPDGATGYGANMQPALAAAVDAGVTGAAAAWARYLTRDPKQDYSGSPQFAVVPATQAGIALRPLSGPPRRAAGPRLLIGPGQGLMIGIGDGAGFRLFDLRGKRLPEKQGWAGRNGPSGPEGAAKGAGNVPPEGRP
jgi:hypothetical protein